MGWRIIRVSGMLTPLFGYLLSLGCLKYDIQQGGTKGFFGSFLDNIKVLWRYGYFSPKNTQNLYVFLSDPRKIVFLIAILIFWTSFCSVKDMTDKFVKLYAPEALKWENLTDISDAFEWDELISQTASEYFRSHGVSEKFTNEVIDAMTLVNYAQVRMKPSSLGYIRGRRC